jgi:hypothetical protein
VLYLIIVSGITSKGGWTNCKGGKLAMLRLDGGDPAGCELEELELENVRARAAPTRDGTLLPAGGELEELELENARDDTLLPTAAIIAGQSLAKESLSMGIAIAK